MSSTLKPTTMALDEESVAILEELSDALGISKAEVIRRSLKEVHTQHQSGQRKKTPLEALAWLQDNGISREAGEQWKAALKAEREAWESPWDQHLTSPEG